MNWPIDWSFDWSILGAPLAAGLLIVATHVLLGREVLRRGIIFIDLTIAQMAALGAVVAEVLEWEAAWQVQSAAATVALSAGGLLAWTESRWPDKQEALIGGLYVVSASAAILLLAQSPHGAEHFAQLMAGQILWVSWTALLPLMLLTAVLLAVWSLGMARRPLLFYLAFALVITASVQLAGVYLVFATLILPALATSGRPDVRGLAGGYALGATAYGLGLWLSVPTDLPSGPLIVCLLAGLSLVAAASMGRLESQASGPTEKR